MEKEEKSRNLKIKRSLGGHQKLSSKMLQILTISAFTETNYEFGILGQKSRNFFKKSRKT